MLVQLIGGIRDGAVIDVTHENWNRGELRFVEHVMDPKNLFDPVDPMAPVEERLIVYRRKAGQRRDYLYLMRQEHA
jgi:hypothetical protein